MTTIVITEAALPMACHPDCFSACLGHKGAPVFFGQAIIREDRGVVLVALSGCTTTSRYLIIGSEPITKLSALSAEEQYSFFDRSVRIGLRSFDKRIALSPKAMPYHEGARVSVFAAPGLTLRIIAEESYAGSRNVFVYDLREASESKDLGQQTPDPNSYNQAMTIIPAMFEVAAEAESGNGSAIDLEWQGTQQIAKGFAYAEWLPLLSSRQRSFVEREVAGPLRVRGAAGTGKTLAMVMKALKVAKDAGDEPVRILFLTHSWAMAGQIDEMLNSIGRDITSASLIEVYPLLEMARQRDYSLVGRRPLGLDSETGILKALDVIEELISSYVASDWVAYRGGSSPGFVERMEAEAKSPTGRSFAWDLLIEFGCVLAADGLLARQADRERYLRIRRAGYMMRLIEASEKEVVFALWGAFLSYLREHGFIATDQIVSDYLSDLRTFYWEAKRAKDGYDYVFVDEMHLFNAQERLVFHNLLADGSIVPNVIMALDPKQSPREVFADIQLDSDQASHTIYERAQLPNPAKIDFVHVYRYTDEITLLIRSVLDAVPGLDMSDDWDLPIGSSISGSGPKPQYKIVANLNATFSTAIALAKSLQSEARTKGGQVAILCMDYDRFAKIHPAAKGQNPKDVYVISSRDDVEKLRFMKQRIVFSTPEYVAGLQFDTVILVDVNANLVPDGIYRGSAERRFLSELYLGMSRAERRLIVIASQDCDGLAAHLLSQENSGLIEKLP